MKAKQLLLSLLILLSFTINAQNPIMVITGYGGATTVSIGQTLEIDAFFYPTDATQPVTWEFNNVAGEISLDPSDDHCIITGVTAGLVTITATATNDASLTASIDITVVDAGGAILVNAIIVQGQGGATTISQPGGTLQMTAEVLPANATDPSYTWSVDNISGSAQISQTGLLTAISDGIVRVNATANDASQTLGSIEITIDQTASIIDESLNNNIKIYPNPASDFITVSKPGSEPAQVAILDLTGKTLQKVDLNHPIETIDLANLKEGIYLIKIQFIDKKNILMKKLIVK